LRGSLGHGLRGLCINPSLGRSVLSLRVKFSCRTHQYGDEQRSALYQFPKKTSKKIGPVFMDDKEVLWTYSIGRIFFRWWKSQILLLSYSAESLTYLCSHYTQISGNRTFSKKVVV